MSEVRHVEATKLLFDLFKHGTTVSTGSILILVTFLEKLFKFPVYKWLIAVSFLGFTISIVTSLLVMLLFAAMTRKPFHEKDDKSVVNTLVGSFIGDSLSFIVGIISLVIFSLINFYQ